MMRDMADENTMTSQCLTALIQFFWYRILYKLSAALGNTYMANSARRLSCSTMMAAPEHVTPNSQYKYLLLPWTHPFLIRLRWPQICDWYNTTKTAKKTEERRVLNDVLERIFTGLWGDGHYK